MHNEKNIAHNLATCGLKNSSSDIIHYVLSTERTYKNSLNGEHGSTVFSSFVCNTALKLQKKKKKLTSHRLDSWVNQILKDNLVSSSPGNRLQSKTCGRALSFLQRLHCYFSREQTIKFTCRLPTFQSTKHDVSPILPPLWQTTLKNNLPNFVHSIDGSSVLIQFPVVVPYYLSVYVSRENRAFLHSIQEVQAFSHQGQGSSIHRVPSLHRLPAASLMSLALPCSQGTKDIHMGLVPGGGFVEGNTPCPPNVRSFCGYQYCKNLKNNKISKL